MKILPKLVSRLQNKKVKQSSSAQKKKSAVSTLSLLIFMVDWPMFKLIFSVFEEEKVPLYFIHKGRGTATSDVIDLLGIGTSEKAVILCLEQPNRIPALLKGIRKKIGPNKQGTGIAFTIPLSAINSPILQAFKPLDDGKTDSKTDKKTGDQSAEAYSHALVYSVINRGFSDEFMETARKAGASGGTLLHARYQAHQGTVKFFGISVQEEREIILILTSQDKKKAILKAVSAAHGLKSKSQGLIFSLPVDKAMSLSFVQEFNA